MQLEDRYIVIPRDRIKALPCNRQVDFAAWFQSYVASSTRVGKSDWKGLVVRDSWPIYPFVEAILMEWLNSEEAHPHNELPQLAKNKIETLPVGLSFRQYIEELSVNLDARTQQLSVNLDTRTQQVRFLLELLNVPGAHTMGVDHLEEATATAKRNVDDRAARHEEIREALGLTHDDVLAHPSGTFTGCAINEIQRLKDRLESSRKDYAEVAMALGVNSGGRDPAFVREDLLTAVKRFQDNQELLVHRNAYGAVTPPYVRDTYDSTTKEIGARIMEIDGPAKVTRVHDEITVEPIDESETQRLKDRIASLVDGVRRRDDRIAQQATSDDDADETLINGVPDPRSPYDRLVVQRVTGHSMYVDIYEILAAFHTGSSILDHLVKKALAPGLRGTKDRRKDLQEIEWSAKCAVTENEARIAYGEARHPGVQELTAGESVAGESVAADEMSRFHPDEGDPQSLAEARGHRWLNQPYGDLAKDFENAGYRRCYGLSDDEAEKFARRFLREKLGWDFPHLKIMKAEDYLTAEEAEARRSAIPEGERIHQKAVIKEFARTAKNPLPRSGYVTTSPCREWTKGQTRANPEQIGGLLENVRLNRLGAVIVGEPVNITRQGVVTLLDALDIPASASVGRHTGFLLLCPGMESDFRRGRRIEAAEMHCAPILLWSELVDWAKREAGE